MAEHGSVAQGTGGTPEEAAFLKDRQEMLGGFARATTYAVGVVVAVLVLMAIFLL